MKIIREEQTLEAVAEPEDLFEIELQHDIAGGYKLYIHTGGRSILRIGKIRNAPNLRRTNGTLLKKWWVG